MGTIDIDLSGKIEASNTQTGEWLEIELQPKTWSNKTSILTGSAYDQRGVTRFQIQGSWNDGPIKIKNLRTCVWDTVWQADKPQPPMNGYGMSHNLTYSLNQLTPEMQGYIPVTDSRFREDQRLAEQGKFEQAQICKEKLEQQQRSNKNPQIPNYFEIKDFADDTKIYILNKGENGYWEQRESNGFNNN